MIMDQNAPGERGVIVQFSGESMDQRLNRFASSEFLSNLIKQKEGGRYDEGKAHVIGYFLICHDHGNFGQRHCNGG
jgi:hypothetical protein